MCSRLTRVQVEKRLRIARPTSTDIAEYYDSYADSAARLVRARPAAL